MNQAELERVFNTALFGKHIGLELIGAGEGWCETQIVLGPHHQQQEGFVHAGVQATMADHTGGCAASTLVSPRQYVLTVEFKINLLRPAKGERLRCRAQVLKAGKSITVVESEVFTDKLVSKATMTLAVLEASP
jgi:uncharacterized protein (TIGR00369 family)